MSLRSSRTSADSFNTSVTYNVGKDTERLINISKIIYNYFSRRAREDANMANEMRNALRAAGEI